jgi:hypothetical protein
MFTWNNCDNPIGYSQVDKYMIYIKKLKEEKKEEKNLSTHRVNCNHTMFFMN